MLRIKAAREGKKHKPFYFILLVDNRRRNKVIEKIGYFDPIKKDHFYLNIERYNTLLKNGAQPTKRVLKVFSLSCAKAL